MSQVISSLLPYMHFPIRKNLALPLFILAKFYQVSKQFIYQYYSLHMYINYRLYYSRLRIKDMKILTTGMKRTHDLNSIPSSFVLSLFYNKCTKGGLLAAKVTTIEDMRERIIEKIIIIIISIRDFLSL